MEGDARWTNIRATDDERDAVGSASFDGNGETLSSIRVLVGARGVHLAHLSFSLSLTLFRALDRLATRARAHTPTNSPRLPAIYPPPSRRAHAHWVSPVAGL